MSARIRAVPYADAIAQDRAPIGAGRIHRQDPTVLPSDRRWATSRIDQRALPALGCW
jgi:hypothetical protein